MACKRNDKKNRSIGKRIIESVCYFFFFFWKKKKKNFKNFNVEEQEADIYKWANHYHMKIFFFFFFLLPRIVYLAVSIMDIIEYIFIYICI